MRRTLQERVLLARDGFMTHTVDAVATGMRPAFDCVLLPQPKIRHTQWDHGDTTSRALLAWLYIRQITGDNTTGRLIEEGLWKHLLSVLHPQTGLAFVPENSDLAGGHYYYHLWDQGRALTYLAARLQWSWNDAAERKLLLALIRRLQKGLLHLGTQTTLPDGSVALWWKGDAFWDESPTLPTDRDYGDQNWTGWCLVSSQMIEPQTMLAQTTGEQSDLDLALMTARGFLAGFEERRHSTSPMFAADGHFRGHFHSAVSGLLGLVKLSRLLWDRGEKEQATKWIDLVIGAYEWIFDSHRNVNPGCSCGYFPETAKEEPHGCSELCCVADMMELAAALAQCAALHSRWEKLSDLWDDVERFTRNEIFKMQLTHVESVLPHVISTARVTAEQSRQLLMQMLGTWGSCRSFLNDAGMYPGRKGVQLNMPSVEEALLVSDDTPMLTSGGCCAYSGVRAIHVVWQQMIKTDGDETCVRIASEYENANVVLGLLEAGGITFHAQRAHALRIRIPSRVKFETVRVQGVPENAVKASADKRWLLLTLDSNDRGTIQWPMPQWSTREVAGPINHMGILPNTSKEDRLTCTLEYRGNELVRIEPAAIKLPYIQGL